MLRLHAVQMEEAAFEPGTLTGELLILATAANQLFQSTPYMSPDAQVCLHMCLGCACRSVEGLLWGQAVVQRADACLHALHTKKAAAVCVPGPTLDPLPAYVPHKSLLHVLAWRSELVCCLQASLMSALSQVSSRALAAAQAQGGAFMSAAAAASAGGQGAAGALSSGTAAGQVKLPALNRMVEVLLYNLPRIQVCS